MKQITLTRSSAAILIAALGASKAEAQTSPLIIDRGRIDQPQEQAVPAPQPTETLRGRLDFQDVKQDGAAAALAKVGIFGSSLPAATLAPAWKDKVGKPLDRALVAEIAAGINKIYEKSDIAIFTILAPAQDLADGGLGFKIIEGRVAEIVIQTNDQKAKSIQLAREYAQKLTKERPLRRSTLQRYLSLIRDIPGENIDAQFIPGRGDEIKLVLILRHSRFDVGFGINNRGTPLLGRTQVSVDGSINDLFRGGDQTTLSISAPVEKNRFFYAALSHSTPIGSDGMRLNLGASQLKTRLDSGIDGDAETYSISASYPLIRSYTKNLNLSLGLDTLDSSNAAFGYLLDSSSTRTVRGSLAYNQSSAKSSLGASASLSISIDGLGAEASPYFSQADFSKLNLQLGYDRIFAERYVLRLHTGAQISDSMLPASEQMALGGESYGRAFEGAVLQGDQGLAGSVEAALRINDPLPSWLHGSETYVFADAGKIWLNERPFLFPNLDFSLASAGGGLRFALGPKTTIGLEAATALEEPYSGAGDDWRFTYSIVSRH